MPRRHIRFGSGLGGSILLMPMKQCRKCLQDKETAEFAWRNKKKGTLQAYCKQCRKGIDASLWNERPEFRQKKIERTSSYRKRNKEYVLAYLRTHACVDCGEQDPVVLDFDHKHSKISDIASLMDNASLQTLQLEIDKCDVRCANCHRRKTAKERNYFQYREMG